MKRRKLDQKVVRNALILRKRGLPDTSNVASSAAKRQRHYKAPPRLKEELLTMIRLRARELAIDKREKELMACEKRCIVLEAALRRGITDVAARKAHLEEWQTAMKDRFTQMFRAVQLQQLQVERQGYCTAIVPHWVK